MSEYFCLDCNQPRETTVHGDCATCGSVAICLSDPPRYDGRMVERLIETAKLAVERTER